MLQGESGAARWGGWGRGGAQRGVSRHAMKVAREARLAASKSDRVWKGDKWVKRKRGDIHVTKRCSQH